jgi:uncharacterized protein YggE
MAMWQNSLTIQNPYGISVFGSALFKASPDSASITAAVTRLETKPAESFSRAKEGARLVVEFLRRRGVEEFGTSRITLAAESRFVNGELQHLGYRAAIGFKIVTHALDTLKEIVAGVIEAGANQISSIDFRTSSLKELRAKARRQAIEAAKEKAAIYAEAGGVSLGSIIHIQDVNPEVLQHRSESHNMGRGATNQTIVDEDAGQILDPGAVEIGAAVLVAFALRTET